MIRVCDPQAELEERMVMLGIAVYGYLKRVAAIHGLQRKKEQVSKEEAIYHLRWLMDRMHDPLLWDQMRLGL
ncbi:MAG: hypothetical protein IPO13_07115 [Rhodocyclaceae bacterium]|nr:hypothetical protein [Rhodocyclaceae bacterium]